MATELFGFVYFIEAEGLDRIKIGWTDSKPSRRLTGLQVGSCVRLLPLGVLIGLRQLEKELHAMFADLREDGEWFCATQLLREFIREVVLPWPNPKERIVRPGDYKFKESQTCLKAFPCDQCRSKVCLEDQWVLYESSQGDKTHLCLECVRVPGERLKGRIRIKPRVQVENTLLISTTP